MQANKFVKKFGWNDARVCILNCACPEDRWLMRHGEFISDDAFDDLKRLVESWELVEVLGGVEYAKYSLECMALQVIDGGCDDQYKTLKQAIADVESCQSDLPESVILSLGEVS